MFKQTKMERLCGRINHMDRVASYVQEPIRHFECPGKRVLDLRPYGVPFVPILSLSNPPNAQQGPSSLHIHRGCVEIVYCVRGANFRFETPKRDYPFLTGTLFVSRDTEPHRLNSNPRGHFVYRVLVALPKLGRNFEGLAHDESEWLRSALLALPRSFHVDTDEIRRSFERLFASYDGLKSTPRGSFALRIEAFDLLHRVIDMAERAATVRDDAAVLACVRRVKAAPEIDYDFGAMSREVRLPPGVFARRFAEIAGLTPRAYRNACRIQKACSLLDAGRSVANVAFSLSFCSTSYFTTVFKRETGETPSERIRRREMP